MKFNTHLTFIRSAMSEYFKRVHVPRSVFINLLLLQKDLVNVYKETQPFYIPVNTGSTYFYMQWRDDRAFNVTICPDDPAYKYAIKHARR